MRRHTEAAARISLRDPLHEAAACPPPDAPPSQANSDAPQHAGAEGEGAVRLRRDASADGRRPSGYKVNERSAARP